MPQSAVAPEIADVQASAPEAAAEEAGIPVHAEVVGVCRRTDPIELLDGRSYHVVWTEQIGLDDDASWAEAVAPGDDV